MAKQLSQEFSRSTLLDGKVTSNNRIYKEIALELNISPQQVEEFHKVICQFTSEVISKGRLDTVMIPGLGKLRAKMKQIQFLTNRKMHDEAIRVK